jgi:hypothetical protein
MSFVMSLLQTTARLGFGFAPNLASAWLTSFAIGVTAPYPPRSSSPPALSGWPATSPARRAARRRTSASKQPRRSPIAAVAVARRAPDPLCCAVAECLARLGVLIFLAAQRSTATCGRRNYRNMNEARTPPATWCLGAVTVLAEGATINTRWAQCDAAGWHGRLRENMIIRMKPSTCQSCFSPRLWHCSACIPRPRDRRPANARDRPVCTATDDSCYPHCAARTGAPWPVRNAFKLWAVRATGGTMDQPRKRGA